MASSVKSTVSTISKTATSISKSVSNNVSKTATSSVVSCARDNSLTMVPLREWYNDKASYCSNTYEGFCSSITWNDKSNTATVYMRGDGYANYVNIKPGKDGSYIKDGRLYVDEVILWRNLGSAIDQPAKKIHDVDALIIGGAIAGKGISSGVKLIKGISAADAASGTAIVKGGKESGLLDELASSGVKYNPKDLVSVTKTADGKLVWLENGSETAGLNHIIKDHGVEFANKGIAHSEIPNYVTKALSDGKVVGYQGRGTGRPIYEFAYNGVTQRVAVTTGSNGFIVGANPVSIK